MDTLLRIGATQTLPLQNLLIHLSMHRIVTFWLIWTAFCLPLIQAQAIQTVIFEEDFEMGTPQPEWTLRPSLSGNHGLVEVVSGIGLGNRMGLRMGKTSHADGFTVNAIDLSLDLSAYPEVELTFWIASVYDETQYQDGLFLSDDGGNTFVRVWEFPTSDWCNGYGQFPPIRISQLARENGLDPQSTQFVIRFSQEGEKAFNSGSNQDGHHLDEIKVYVPARSYAPLPFEEDFETGSLRSMWAWRSAEASTQILNGTSFRSNSSLVAVQDQHGADGSTYALLLGKTCNDGFSNQAVDLHLDLTGAANVEMTFDIRDHFDESQIDDAIFFSDDGGETFVKVFELDPDEWCSGYGQFAPFDVDQMAHAAGLTLSERFIIRFQQRGHWVTTNSSNSDGMRLDNVRVYDPGLTFVSIPFSDDFETGRFGPMWAWRSAEATAAIQLDGPATRRSAWVTVADRFGSSASIAYNSTYAAALGNDCGDDFSNSALDLHLNLAQTDSVFLSAWIRANKEEAQLDDALFMSADGGQTFQKAYQFPHSNFFQEYQEYIFDLSSLADSLGMSLTDSFVVRFQQHGNRRFWGSSDVDGLYIDDVAVTGTVRSTDIHSPLPSPQVSLYPNPAKHHLMLLGPKEKQITDIRVADPMGKEIACPWERVSDGRIRLCTLNLSEGMYILRVNLAGSWRAFRFLKQD